MREIKLTKGKFAQVDDEDYEWLNQWKWMAIKCGNTWYAMRNKWIKEEKKRKFIKMHQLIMGDNPLKLDIDHKDRSGVNNQRSNLRFCTRSQNLMNRISYPNRSSKYKGVSFNKRRGKFESFITVNRVKKNLGYFTVEEDAARLHDSYAVILHGEFARPNFPVNKSQKWLDV